MILGSLTERITCTIIKNKRQETQRIFLGETIKGENPATSSEIESTPKLKPKKHKDDLSTAVVSLSDPSNLSLTHVPQ